MTERFDKLQRKASPDHDDLKKDKTQEIIDDWKTLDNWNKA